MEPTHERTIVNIRSGKYQGLTGYLQLVDNEWAVKVVRPQSKGRPPTIKKFTLTPGEETKKIDLIELTTEKLEAPALPKSIKRTGNVNPELLLAYRQEQREQLSSFSQQPWDKTLQAVLRSSEV